MNPISDALHELVTADEAAFRAAHRGRGIDLGSRARRARRARVATQTGLIVASAAVLTFSAFSISAAVRQDSTDTDPVAPPVPEGYERVVIQLGLSSVMVFSETSDDPAVVVLGIEDFRCGAFYQMPNTDSETFRLDVTSATPANLGTQPETSEGDPALASATAKLTYDGSSGGVAAVTQTIWTILRSDGTVAFSVTSYTTTPNSEASTAFNHLDEPFVLDIEGYLLLADCAKTHDLNQDSFNHPEEVPLGPGSYSVVAMAKVEWSAVGAILLDAHRLGYDPSWFGEGWRGAVPCRDAVTEAKRAQNGNAIECVPNLYYQQIPNVGNYAIVDVPNDFLDGPRKTWYVVSEPYPLVVP